MMMFSFYEEDKLDILFFFGSTNNVNITAVQL